LAEDIIEKLHYYPRQFLTAPALQTEQNYHRDMRRRHNVAHHTWGIVVGLELKFDSKTGEVSLYPGFAIDGFGREIVVMRVWTLLQADFSSFTPGSGTQAVDVYVAYDWGAAQQPAQGFELCDDPNQFQVVQETFMIVPSLPSPAIPPKSDDITVDGSPASPTAPPQAPIDMSVPYQELPEDPDLKNQFIYLGTLYVDLHGAFTSQVDQTNRRYAGVVADKVYGPDGTLTLRSRSFDEANPHPTYPNPFATIDGALEVKSDLVSDEDIYLTGEFTKPTAGYPTINFQGSSSTGQDQLSIRRKAGPAADEIRAQIGDVSPSQNRFTVGPHDKDALVVGGDLNVVIPNGQLEFDLAGSNSIGTSAGQLRFQSTGGFGWVKGSMTASPFVSMDSSGNLKIDGDLTSGGDRLYLLTKDSFNQSWIVAGTPEAGNTALGFDNTNQVLIGKGWKLAFMDPVGTIAGNVQIDNLTVNGAITSNQHELVDVLMFGIGLGPGIGVTTLPFPTFIANPVHADVAVALQQGATSVFDLVFASVIPPLLPGLVTVQIAYFVTNPMWCNCILVVK
jgi:hypothetical protein